MAALTKAYETQQKPTVIVSYPVAASTTIYKGALVGVNSIGYVVPMDHATASLTYMGIAEETVDNSSGSDGDVSVRVSKTGSGVFADAGTATQADIGQTLNVKTDNEVQVGTLSLTNVYAVGTLVALETTSTGATGLRVRIDNDTK
ncbi:MAG: hypothetical protein IH851_05430 [Armatimonadetes bacterium]|nr:hypothetical protein [Armatimonadota bacterium]